MPEKTAHLPPVFVIGAPRSGTSLLYKALCLHPDAAWLSNWVRRLPAVPEAAALNRIAGRLSTLRRQVWFGGGDGSAYVYGSGRGQIDRAFPQPVEGEPTFARAGIPEFPPPGQDEIDADDEALGRLRKALGLVTEWSGGRCLVNKRIANNLRIPLLHRAFPNARFVVLTRDGRAVAVSCSKVDWWPDSRIWWYGGTPLDWEAEGRDPWELCGRHWVEELHAIDHGLRSVPGPQVLRTTYEELVTDPIGTLHRIAGFTELGTDPGWSRELDDLGFPDKNERWRDALSPEAEATITGVQADELRARGYLH